MKTTTSRPSTVLTATTLLAVLSLAFLNICCLRTAHAQDDDTSSTSTGSVVFDQANAQMRIDAQYARAQIAANQVQQDRMVADAQIAAAQRGQNGYVEPSAASVSRETNSSSRSSSGGALGWFAVFVIGFWIWIGSSKKSAV